MFIKRGITQALKDNLWLEKENLSGMKKLWKVYVR
jgi:hypothetical protein